MREIHIKKHRRKRHKHNLFITVIVVSIGLSAYGLLEYKIFGSDVIDKKLSQTANLVTQKNLLGGAKYSLDLSVAREATYTSSPIHVSKNLPPVGAVSAKLITFRSESLKEYALMTQPSSLPPVGGYPVVILLHGFVQPESFKSDGNAYLPDMLYYSQHGYVVIRPDLRGNGMSEGIPEGAYYSMAYNVDILNLVDAVKQTSYLNKDDINLWGHSMGGYLALRAAVTSPDIKRAILLSGSVGTPKDMFSLYTAPSDALNPIALKIREELLAQHGTPLSNPEYWEKASPYSYLDKTNTFIQLHVGTADEVVPPQFSSDLNQALYTAKKPHQYYVYPAAEHGLVTVREQIDSRSLAALRQTSFTSSE